MKHMIFFVGLLLAVPAGVILASFSRRFREWIFAGLVFSTAFADRWDINFVSREWYRAMTRGFEISFVDLLALVLLLSTLASMRREKFRPYWPASLGFMLAFLAYCALNVAVSEPKLFGLFSLSVLVRGLAIFLAVAYHVRSERDVYILVLVLGAELLYQGGLSIMQRYVWLEYRVQGTLPHPNFFGNYCCMFAPLLLWAALSKMTPGLRALSAVSYVFCGVAIMLTISRMSTTVFMASTIGVLMTGLGARPDLKKLALALLLAVAAGSMYYRASDIILARHEAMSAGSEGIMADRTANYTLAGIIAEDRPFRGVGLNNWSYWVTNKFGAEIGQEYIPYTDTNTPPEGTPAVFCHSMYGLTLGELGWPGLLLLLALFARLLAITGRYFFTGQNDISSMLGRGCFFVFLSVLAIGLSECNFRAQYIYLLFSILVGFVAAMIHVQRVKKEPNILRAGHTIGYIEGH